MAKTNAHTMGLGNARNQRLESNADSNTVNNRDNQTLESIDRIKPLNQSIESNLEHVSLHQPTGSTMWGWGVLCGEGWADTLDRVTCLHFPTSPKASNVQIKHTKTRPSPASIKGTPPTNRTPRPFKPDTTPLQTTLQGLQTGNQSPKTNAEINARFLYGESNA